MRIDVATIQTRQESVQELLQNELAKPVISENLRTVEANITCIIKLKHVLDIIPALIKALDMASSTLLKTYAE
ncbi:hypothetical protein SARC_06276, partial [Sphaeroforma arctica JP610]